MEVQKPWDLKALAAGLKAEGLPVAEVAAEKVAKVTFEWLEASLLKMGGIVAAVAIPILASVKPSLMAEIDKIDGQPG